MTVMFLHKFDEMYRDTADNLAKSYCITLKIDAFVQLVLYSR